MLPLWMPQPQSALTAQHTQPKPMLKLSSTVQHVAHTRFELFSHKVYATKVFFVRLNWLGTKFQNFDNILLYTNAYIYNLQLYSFAKYFYRFYIVSSVWKQHFLQHGHTKFSYEGDCGCTWVCLYGGSTLLSCLPSAASFFRAVIAGGMRRVLKARGEALILVLVLPELKWVWLMVNFFLIWSIHSKS